jgi:hypothetical protein
MSIGPTCLHVAAAKTQRTISRTVMPHSALCSDSPTARQVVQPIRAMPFYSAFLRGRVGRWSPAAEAYAYAYAILRVATTESHFASVVPGLSLNRRQATY